MLRTLGLSATPRAFTPLSQGGTARNGDTKLSVDPVVAAFDLAGNVRRGRREFMKGLTAVAWADDGTLEAVEDQSRRFAVGVLWHPEAGEDRRLFEEFVRQAEEYRAGR